MAEEVKIGTYICKGCDLGNRLNTDQLEMIATREGKASFAKSHDFLCGVEGVKMIQDDLDSGEATRIVIAACSRRAKTDAFRFDGVAVTRANLREGVIWIRPDNEEALETTQEMAEDYIRMGCAEIKFMADPKPSEEQGTNRHVLVVGGGITGMTAAYEAAKAGYKATIIEKDDKLGGIAAQLHRRAPTRAPYAHPEDTSVEKLAALLEEDSNVTIMLNSTIGKTSGAPGRFEVAVGDETLSVGSIVQASGFKPFDANKLTEFSYDKSENVITQLELEKLAKDADGGAIKRPSDGKEVKNVVFVQCAGQRSNIEGHLSYCSGHCCNTSIKQAMYFKDQNQDIETTIVYRDLRTPGAAGEDFYRSGQDKMVTFHKGCVTEVSTDCKVKFNNLILDEDQEIDADLVVLATGMEANSGINTEYNNTVAAEVTRLTAAKEEIPAELKAQQEVIATIPVESILNLDYRQGSDLPQLVSGFTDSHFICFPYETRRTGIYAAGPTRRPMDSSQAQEDATGATMKAIQAIENAGQGRAAHPRSGDLSYPSFRMEGCTQCKRCTVECPFGAIDEDEKGYPQYNEARCRRCGTCMGACPVRVISFENYSIDTVGQQIKAVDMPDEFDEKPRILVLACENDAYPALDMAAQNRFEYSAFVRVVPVRCLGSVNTIWITDALNSGYDGIVLMGCKKGDDYQCHFVKGSEMAHTRMSKIADTLQTLSLEEERVEVHEVAITDIQRVPEIINSMAETIEKIGMSPFKF
ncbi:MAG: FAD-dependent oxidoreductase [Pseudomonadota bacterium]